MQKEERITLNLLQLLETKSSISQRGIAGELGIALGATNAHLRRCLRQGFIQKQPITNTRYYYTVTGNGFQRKCQLLTKRIQTSLNLYDESRRSCKESIREAIDKGFKGAYIYGDSTLAEIMYLSLLDVGGIEMRGFVGCNNKQSFIGQPTVTDVLSLKPSSAILFAKLEDCPEHYQKLCLQQDSNRIIVPSLLNSLRPIVK